MSSSTAVDVACHLNVLVPDVSSPALEGALDVLAIWRAPYLDGAALARDAMTLIRRGIDAA